MEGPSLFLAQQQLVEFKGQKVRVVSGNTKIGKERFQSKEIMDIFSWGKHLCFQLDDFAIRVHFLLFGTFEAVVNGVPVTGDYKRTREPRLKLDFVNGEISMFNCSITLFETDDLKSTYDFSTDIMSPQWNSEQAFFTMRNHTSDEIADALLDQEIFSGVGNIIKNEVLSQTHTHPMRLVGSIGDEKLREIITATHNFSHQFYLWRKNFVLRKHLLVHRKSVCPHCGAKMLRGKTGKRQRWSYYCSLCQM